ncbi:MAG: trigger factor [Candidatus Pacebacteria bacterium]|nr:trigger factor [Candidatus Paceibacterota bacterium]
MDINKKDLEKSQVELTVTLSVKEFEPYIKKGAEKLSEKVKIEGFRPGKAPLDVVKSKVGEMALLEEAAYLAINKTLDKALDEGIDKDSQAVGQPQVSITKLAPNNDLEYKLTVAVLPEVEITKYKDLGIEEEKVEVDQKQIDKTLGQLAEMRAQEKIVDREIKEEDKVIVDIFMSQDKVPVEGGQSQDATIIIGKDYFVPGFDKQLLGAKKNEEKNFSLPFPENHHQKNLAGKMVEFKVKIKEVYERSIPKVDDDFAKTLQFKGLNDLRSNLEKNVQAETEQKAKQKTEIKMLEELLKKAKVGELPQVLIDNEARNMLAELKKSVEQQGMKFEDYLSSLKKSEEELTLELLPEAIKRVKVALVIRKIAQTEKIEVSDEEVNKQLEAILDQNKGKAEVEKMLKSQDYRNYLHNLLINQKVIKQLKEWNVKTK